MKTHWKLEIGTANNKNAIKTPFLPLPKGYWRVRHRYIGKVTKFQLFRIIIFRSNCPPPLQRRVKMIFYLSCHLLSIWSQKLDTSKRFGCWQETKSTFISTKAHHLVFNVLARTLQSIFLLLDQVGLKFITYAYAFYGSFSFIWMVR